MRRLLLLTAAAGLLAVSLMGAGFAAPRNDDDDDGDNGRAVSWTVKVTNLTTGQPFTAPLWAVHNGHADVWSVGEQASNGVSLIAEDGYNAPLEGLLDADDNVYDAETAPPLPAPPANRKPPPPHALMLPGTSREFVVSSQGNFHRLSLIWMLVRTNDAFTGLDSVKLKAGTWLVNAYDGGSEANNENPLFTPPNFFVRDQSAELIKPHPGLVAGFSVWAWQGPVARIEITKAG